jgi:HEAT repeat protein
MRTLIHLAWLFVLLLLLPLAGTGQPEAVAEHDEIIRLGMQVKDPNPEVRLQAIKALSEKHDQRASEWLVTALRDPDPQLRAAAATGLSNKYYLQATPALLPLLDDPDVTVRAPAAQALGAHRNWEAVDPLLMALKDPAPVVRAGAAMGLSNIHGVWALDADNRDAG